MNDIEIKLALESIGQLEVGKTVGEQNKGMLNQLVVGYHKAIETTLDLFDKINVIPIITGQSDITLTIKKFEDSKYSVLDKYVIRTPEGVVGPMIPYLSSLEEAVDALATIDKRLLSPLKLYLGKALTNSGDIDKVWLDDNLVTIDVDKFAKQIGKYYDDKVGDDLSFVRLHEAYPKPSDFKTATEIMDKLIKHSTELMGQEIPKKCDHINGLVNKLVEHNNKSGYMQNTPNQAIIKLSQFLYQTALEVEFLSVVLFQIRIASVAQAETVNKVIKDL